MRGTDLVWNDEALSLSLNLRWGSLRQRQGSSRMSADCPEQGWKVQRIPWPGLSRSVHAVDKSGRNRSANLVGCLLDHYGIAVYRAMQTVLSTSVFLRQAKRAGLTEDDLKEIEWTLAGDPAAGDGCRELAEQAKCALPAARRARVEGIGRSTISVGMMFRFSCSL